MLTASRSEGTRLTVRVHGGAPLAEAFHFPLGLPSARELDVGLTAEARPLDDASLDVALTVRARRFAQSVTIDADGFVPADDWFHIVPGGARTVRLRRAGAAKGPLRGTVTALNAEATAKIQLPATTS